MKMPRSSASAGGAPDPRAERLAALAASLGVELPPFPGPLVAFQLDDHRSEHDPVFFGGDLQEIHPRAGGPASPADRDPSLDFATISLFGHEHLPLETSTLEGIWCVRIDGERLRGAPYLSIVDSEGRTRAWLLLPPPQLMVGIAHFWLPSVPPPGDPRG
jgi:hypothetical protein